MSVTDVLLTAQFTNDLKNLPEADQRRVRDAAFRIQTDPDNGGLNPEKIKASKDYWSYRATQSIRIIARREAGVCSLVAVDRHDKAYARAEAGNLAGPPALDILASLRERDLSQIRSAKEVVSGPLSHLSDEALLADYCVPRDWVAAIRTVKDRDGLWLIGIDESISESAFFRLEELFPIPSAISTGAKPVFRLPSNALARAFTNGELEDLQFNLPASSWAIVNSSRRSPTLVKGGPGSGKTLVALYRALHLLDTVATADARVLYVTYTNQLCDDARNKIERLLGSFPSRLTIATYDSIAERIAGTECKTLFPSDVGSYLEKALSGTSIDRAFFQDEIEDCIQWKDISSFPEYEAVERRGRRARLSAAGRNGLWSAYEVYLAELAAQNCRDLGSMRMNAARRSAGLAESEKYDCVIVDEVQDLPLSTLIMLTNLTKGTAKEKNMMLIGDAGQAIYNRGFRWSDVGLRFGGGNVYTLAESERSTQQILDFARLFFGNTEMNQVGETYDIPTASKSGECPRIVDGLEVDERLFEWICSDIEARLNSGINPDKIAIIAHSHNRLASVAAALRSSGILTVFQGTKAFYSKGSVKLITSHAAKGLEFSEVYLPDVNDGIYPFFKNRGLAPDERLEKDAQDAQLLYVAATRAADRLTVLYDRSPSPFIENARSAAISVDGARF